MFKKKEARIRRATKTRASIRKRKLARLSVFRSPRHIYAQVIDGNGEKTLAAASTNEKQFKSMDIYSGNQEAAKKIGEIIAEGEDFRYQRSSI